MGHLGVGEFVLLAVAASWLAGFFLIFKNQHLPIIEKVLWLLLNFIFPLIGLIGYLLFGLKSRDKRNNASPTS